MQDIIHQSMEANQVPMMIILFETVNAKVDSVDVVLGEDGGNLYDGD